MADDLNKLGNSNPGENPPINNTPTQSPLEQAGSAGTHPAETSLPSTPAASEPIQTQDSVLPELQSSTPEPPAALPIAPPVTEPDLGESSTPPDTDEFLKSILQQQPQASPQAEPQPENIPPLDNQAPASVANEPIIEQPQTPPLETPEPNLNEKPIDQLQATPETQIMPDTPPAVPGSVEVSNLQQPSEPKISDGISLDGVSNAAPSAPSPIPGQADFSSATPIDNVPMQNQNGTGVKKIIIAILVIAILAGGYYAYSTIFAPSGKSTSNNSLPITATRTTATGAVNSSDIQRKSDLAIVKDALIDYSASSSGRYPISANYAFLSQPGNILEKELVPVYLSKLPQDPSASKSYAYKSDGATFSLTAELDNPSDPEAQPVSGKYLYEINSASGSDASSTSGNSAFGSTVTSVVPSTAGTP